MNIERLYPIVFILCALIGAIVGKTTGHGILHGMTDGMIIAALPVFLLILTHLIWMAWRPDRPVCRCGQCRYKDYVYLGSTGETRVESTIQFKCPKCGRLYEQNCNRFDERMKDGKRVPYMSHTPWGRWKQTEP